MSIEPFTSVFTSIFYFAVVLGLAVIFHEWGHFIVAKLTGAKVDEFAVGFGKKLFKFNWHGTEYSLRLLPLGGLVKIRGMDPEEELTGAEWEYLQLAPWRRILIVVAGPFMNFVLAYLIYVLMFMVFGQSYTATTTIGQVPVGSWGWEMGLHDGDKITSINGKATESWNDISLLQSDASKDKFSLTIERDGQTITKEKTLPAMLNEIEPNPVESPDLVEGAFITRILPDSPAEKAGLKPGLSVLSIDGDKIENRAQFSNYIASSFDKKDDGTFSAKEMSFLCKDLQGATQTLTVTPGITQPADDALPFQPKLRIGIVYDGEITIQEYLTPSLALLGVSPKLSPVIGTVKENSPADYAGITSDSRIVQINKEPIDDWVDVLQRIYGAEIIQEGDSYSTAPLEITWLSPDNEMHTATVTPQVTLQNIPTPTSLKTGKRYPIASIGIDLKPDRMNIGVLGAVTMSWNKVTHSCGFMLKFLGKLFTGNISHKLLGGPIAIYQISGESGRWGMERFLGFIALLSINLGLINLFPIPPFDGAHAVIYSIETVRRKPLTMKQMETFGKIGFALIIPLFFFLIYNDLARTDLFSWIKGLIF